MRSYYLFEGGHALRIAVGITVLGLLLAGAASAATWTVDDSGGANFTRIQDAIDNARAGDTIMVYSGTYYENVNVNKQLILRGIGMPVVNAKGSGSTITLAADGVRLEGFTATESGNYPEVGIKVTSSNNTLRGNNASYNSYGFELWRSSSNTLSGNTANSNSGDGINLGSSNNNNVTGNTASNQYYGIVLVGSSNKMLRGNTASNNHFGISSWNSGNNNDLTGNTASNNSIGISLSSGNYKIYNNIFNNTNNFYLSGSNIDTWNTTKQLGTNIIGGPYLGGNFWANPSGTGFSQTCPDNNKDGLCDVQYIPPSPT